MISIQKISITDLDTDAIVNAANSGLWAGGGACGAIFRAAGAKELTDACSKIGGCKTGSAVITPGFRLKAKYIIHAVGPVWHGGNDHEPQDLYGCYTKSLELAKEYDLHSIGFPLISAGIFGYPKDKAWKKAIQACRDFCNNNLDYQIDIVFAVLDDDIKELGEKLMNKEYKFNGWEGVSQIKDVNEIYEGIKTPLDLYDALSDVWCIETCAPRLRKIWSNENKTCGQCSITAFLAQDIFGGEVYGLITEEGDTHCFNKVGDVFFDLASEQFGSNAASLVYDCKLPQERELHFADLDKKERYELLKAKLLKKSSAHNISGADIEKINGELING